MAELTSCSEVDELLRRAYPVEGTDRFVVAEPDVKRSLAVRGATVPRHVSVDEGPGASSESIGAASNLDAPVVLKAFGPGIVHKTELDAVRLGLTSETIAPAIEEMRSGLAAFGLAPAGFLVEEQTESGIEVLVGVVDKPPFGQMAVLGLGGTLAELIDDVVTRLCPLTRSDAEQMVGGFAGASLLRGYRSAGAADRDQLVELLLTLAGPNGLVASLGPAVAEFECNPVIMNSLGAVIADARLVLREERTASPPRASSDLDRLFMPSSVAIVGASATRTTVANRALRRYREQGWTQGLYALHPTAQEIEGVPAYGSAGELPERIDHLMVALPAAACAEAIRSAQDRVRFVHVLSSGFAEAGAEGQRLEKELLDTVRAAGARLVGPNSLGVYSPRGRQSFAPGLPREPGHIGGVFQSGGLSGDVIYLLARQGVRFSKAVSSGNGCDVSVGELVSYLVDDYETEIVAVHVEGGADAELIDALRRAKGRKPVILLATGLSPSGSRMAASHTGALTSERRCWDAVSASTGTVVVETAEDFVAVLHHVGRHIDTPVDGDSSVLVIGAGGGASVMAADACDAAGLTLSPCTPAAVRALAEMGFGAGTALNNPVDVPIFQGTSPEMLNQVLECVLSKQAFTDVLLHVDVATYYLLGTYVEELPGVSHLVKAIDALGDVGRTGARLSLVARNVDAAHGSDIDAIFNACAAKGLPLHRTFSEAALATRSAQRLLSAPS